MKEAVLDVELPTPVGEKNTGKPPDYSLREVLSSMVNLPLRTAFLGLDKNDNPLLMDLMDPRPGAILICSDKEAGKLKLAKTLLHSLAFSNRPYEVQFSIISARTNQWRYEHLNLPDYIPHLTNNYDRNAGQAVLEVCDLVESRQHGRNEGACRVVIVDGFDTVPYMDFDVRINFEWLLQEGPYVEIWPIVLMDSRTAMEHKQWVEKFKTRIIGRIKDRNVGTTISSMGGIASDQLINGSEFAVRVSNREHHFYLPNVF
ncbi:MAG: hypothetical protein AB1453_09575 [Chloroflexota bacterium]